MVELKNRFRSAERILINTLNVIPITTVEQNHEVWHSNSSDKWDIFQHQCRRRGGVSTNYRDVVVRKRARGPTMLHMLYFRRYYLSIVQFNPSSLSPNHSATASF
jgi:hypothetical protein